MKEENLIKGLGKKYGTKKYAKTTYSPSIVARQQAKADKMRARNEAQKAIDKNRHARENYDKQTEAVIAAENEVLAQE